MNELIYDPFIGYFITKEDRRNLVVIKYYKWKSFYKHCERLINKYKISELEKQLQ